MGNENRKRGSRGKKSKKGLSDNDQASSYGNEHTSNSYGPTHEITYDRTEGAQAPRPDRRQQVDAAAIFGFIDPDVQQYFKGVEKTLDEAPFETAEGIPEAFHGMHFLS